MTYKVIDLFCGAGGMTLGFVSKKYCGGYQSVFALDNDVASMNTHHRNFGGEALPCDIEEWLKSSEVPSADVVIGGPPCQGFSLLNKKRQGDERRVLWEPFLDVVVRSGARAFVMENVAELFKSPEYADIATRAAADGFETTGAVLNAADFGAPQSRRRTIIVGWRTTKCREPSFPPEQTHFKPDIARATNQPRWRTVRDAIGDLPPTPLGTDIGIDAPLNLHFGRNPTDKSKARYRAVPEGGNRFDLQRNALELTPMCWIRKRSGGTDLFGRLWWDRPSVTIRTEFFKPEKGRYLHPVEHRPITHREAARLMGFPDTFEFCGSKVEIARQIGNAVPPSLAGAIGRMLKQALASPAKEKVTKYGTQVAAE